MGDGENAVRFAEVARRRGDDGALGDDQLPAGLNRQPHVLFADEIERASGRGLTAKGRYVPAGVVAGLQVR